MALAAAPHVHHTGQFLPLRNQEGEWKMALSESDRTCTVYLEGTQEAIAFGVKVSTTVKEIQDCLAPLFQKPPTDIVMKHKVGKYNRVLRARDEVPSAVIVTGIPSFARKAKKYDHPILVIGGGLGAIQAMMDMQLRGRTDIVCLEAHSDFGGHSWIAAANKFTKLQTERGTYHVDYCVPWAPVPFYVADKEYKTWPSRDSLLLMMREHAKGHGLYQYCMFNNMVEKLTPFKGAYAAQYVPTNGLWKYTDEGDGGLIMAGAVSAWPGFLHVANTCEFPGEDDFQGYMEYSSFDKVDYDLCTGHVVSLYGHGAFTIENVRTIVEHRCKKVYVVCRKRNLSGTKMTSWLVGSQPAPLPGAVLLDGFQKMYSLVGFDVWSAFSVHTDAKRSFAQIQQPTIFGVTDVYFLAGYYDLMECVVDEVKRLSHHCIHTKKGSKIECDVFIKAIGTKPSFKVDKQLGIKEVVGTWIMGDPLRYVSLGAKGVQAKNFASFSVGPGFAPNVQICNWFLDFPEDWFAVADKLPRNKAGEWPAYVTSASYGLPLSLALQSTLPHLSARLDEANSIKARKQAESHPLEVYLDECVREWDRYIQFFRKHNMVDDRPDPPYPYTMEIMWELIDKANRVHTGQPVSFF